MFGKGGGLQVAVMKNPLPHQPRTAPGPQVHGGRSRCERRWRCGSGGAAGGRKGEEQSDPGILDEDLPAGRFGAWRLFVCFCLFFSTKKKGLNFEHQKKLRGKWHPFWGDLSSFLEEGFNFSALKESLNKKVEKTWFRFCKCLCSWPVWSNIVVEPSGRLFSERWKMKITVLVFFWFRACTCTQEKANRFLFLWCLNLICTIYIYIHKYIHKQNIKCMCLYQRIHTYIYILNIFHGSLCQATVYCWLGLVVYYLDPSFVRIPSHTGFPWW